MRITADKNLNSEKMKNFQLFLLSSMALKYLHESISKAAHTRYYPCLVNRYSLHYAFTNRLWAVAIAKIK